MRSLVSRSGVVFIAALILVLCESPAWAGKKKKKAPAGCSKGETASARASKNPDCTACAEVNTPRIENSTASVSMEAYTHSGAPAADVLATVIDSSGWDTSMSVDGSGWAPGGGGSLDPDPESGAFTCAINVAMGGGGAPG